MRVVVTGGAGFIGSHLTDSLVSEGHEVVVIDDLSSGRKDQINAAASFSRKDIRSSLLREFEGADTVFHFAADPDVRASALTPASSFDINVAGTFNVLEACRKAGVKRIVFPSTSTVYGETAVIPTPETRLCAPISNYGAGKLACEAFLSSYSATYGIRCTILRYANIFGPRSRHGVMYDFYEKLRKDPSSLEILGDGKQDKSYLYVDDCVSATLTAWKMQPARFDIFNVGAYDKITVSEIAEMLSRLLGLRPRLSYGKGPKGWNGDVSTMLLDTRNIRSLGWRETVSFEEGLRRYIGWLKGRKPHRRD